MASQVLISIHQIILQAFMLFIKSYRDKGQKGIGRQSRQTRRVSEENSQQACKKLACITAAYSYERVRFQRMESQKERNLWEDDDLENYYKFCLQQLLQKPRTAVRICRAW